MTALAKRTGGVLAGETLGKGVFTSLVRETTRMPDSTVIYLDFTGVHVITGSFLREAVLSFRAYCTQGVRGLRPVIANMSDDLKKELLYFLKMEREAFVVCDLDRRGRPLRAEVAGVLENTQKEALKRVTDLRVANAADIARSETKTGPTAWNNRLAGLSAKGLVREETRGRAKFYRPLVEV